MGTVITSWSPYFIKVVTDRNFYEESYYETDIKQKENEWGKHDNKRQMNINLNSLIHRRGRAYLSWTLPEFLWEGFFRKSFMEPSNGTLRSAVVWYSQRETSWWRIRPQPNHIHGKSLFFIIFCSSLLWFLCGKALSNKCLKKSLLRWHLKINLV